MRLIKKIKAQQTGVIKPCNKVEILFLLAVHTFTFALFGIDRQCMTLSGYLHYYDHFEASELCRSSMFEKHISLCASSKISKIYELLVNVIQ